MNFYELNHTLEINPDAQSIFEWLLNQLEARGTVSAVEFFSLLFKNGFSTSEITPIVFELIDADVIREIPMLGLRRGDNLFRLRAELGGV
ncbi:hypothetical protein [Thiomicrospira sp. ALE5]|uniref:hypothetical protein n=1 Tax=Thiomicrospira sp. ALE5 TaxID=748650 RepID=UPI0008E9465C|nr:hypothetical protein [Thiomicrospira sp. ALE5]SFR50817.1 hypothetical protein SAMN03092900_0418 [Thiomicrospira sp. ALE5]